MKPQSTPKFPYLMGLCALLGCSTLSNIGKLSQDTDMSRPWWEVAVIYQIYPRSFMDTGGDGVGDLRGIASRLDYLKSLGIGALWVSPIFPSPMKDGGYDITDYQGIDPSFGTLSDFDYLLGSAHEKSLKIILDLVPNHTSDQHPWFKESRSSRSSFKRGWYIWKDAAPGGGPPNNWLSAFGGSAWQWDTRTQQYYYHHYLKEQPDLNWRNPEVEAAMLNVIRFWLDRGVDGFRVDSPLTLMKDPQFRNNPVNQAYKPSQPGFQQLLPLYTRDTEDSHPLFAKIRSVFNEYPGRVFIAETNLPTSRLVTYYGKDSSEAHLPFNFQLIVAPWTPEAIDSLIREYESALPAKAWPNWTLGNHDHSRIASRVGPAQARIAAVLLLTLRGTPTLYYGDELGMRDVPIRPDQVRDTFEKREPGKGNGRDPERTPMLWDSSRNAGFSSSTPWLPVGKDYASINVEKESLDPHSMLSLYRSLIILRQATPALSSGRLVPDTAKSGILSYSRSLGSDTFLVVLNFSSTSVTYARPPLKGAIVLSTHLDRASEAVSDKITLRPDEGVIVRID